MRIAVAGATGNIGARIATCLEREDHEVVRNSRSVGVDLLTGQGLDAALQGVDAVVDAISSPPISADETRAYFGTTTRDLLAAEERAGVRHHVLLSIVGIDRIEGGTDHYSGKREQERLVEEGRVPWTIVPATQISRLWGVGCRLDRARRRGHHRPATCSADCTRRHRSDPGRGRHRGAAEPLRRCRPVPSRRT